MGSGFFIVNFEQISDIALGFLLLTLNQEMMVNVSRTNSLWFGFWWRFIYAQGRWSFALSNLFKVKNMETKMISIRFFRTFHINFWLFSIWDLVFLFQLWRSLLFSLMSVINFKYLQTIHIYKCHQRICITSVLIPKSRFFQRKLSE